MTPRSFLYVPGNRPELFAKADKGAADALVLDLEDAVPHHGKAAARHDVQRWLTSGADRPAPSTPCWARVNPESIAYDLEAVARPGLAGIFLAKADASGLNAADEILTRLEAERGLDRVGVIGLVESAQSILELATMARHPRLVTFGIGEVDLLSGLRIRRGSRAAAAVDMLRIQVVLHCAAAGLRAPVAPTSTDFRDLDTFGETTRALLELGFRSRTAIHPDQVGIIHDVFTPTEAEVDAAQEVLHRFDAASHGVTTGATGRLIDAAVVREARETLSRRR